ncbi:hypothetical protein AMK26_10440 [Streptomyces sp. CB03234]|uniref:hypothetical protein n=1 Tax=Streptomyces sp. (strain CB03234) TaxID=1703937 RepID=UPI00093ECED6|nr:hypothetical protein [Streptomyces sp. CB03234]OKK06431.1 hypothetical protein AMK26_10440 [Streptomyces sp. CB03234]
MSEIEQPTEPEPSGEPDEPRGVSERTARLILCVVAALAVWGIVAVFPWIAYIALGVLLCLGWQRGHARWTARQDAQAEDKTPEEPEPEKDMGTALRHLVGDDNGVLLTGLRDYLKLPDTRTVRNLLHASGIRVREGVRTSGGNGPGVHQDDIPPAPPLTDGAPGDGCCCRSDTNANTNNKHPTSRREGLRVEAIGQAGAVVHDVSEGRRHHAVRTR